MTDLIFRDTKGAPLTAAEGDANMRELEARINSKAGVTVTGWTQDPATLALTFTMSNGTTIGPLTLPSVPFPFKGTWATGISLIARDLVEHGGSLYYAVSAHETDDFDDDLGAGKLDLFLAGGKAGYVDRGVWEDDVAYARGDGVFWHDPDSALRLWIALEDIAAGVEPGVADDNGWGTLALEGLTPGGGAGAATNFLSYQQLGAITVATIGRYVVTEACKLDAAKEVYLNIGTAAGLSKTVACQIKKNGTTFCTISVSGTGGVAQNTGAVETFAAGDVITVAVSTATAGHAATDLTLTIPLQPI